MGSPKRRSAVALETLGCKLNQSETESLARQFSKAGYELVDTAEGADVYVLNTCTVTHVADRKSRHLLRMARRRNPNALVVATGCYAQGATEDLARMKEVDLAVANGDKERLVQIIRTVRGDENGTRPSSDYSPSRTRASVKIQDGCNQFCSYCIVPIVRGRERSFPAGRVLEEIRARVAEGCREIVLTGTQIGHYGQGREKPEAATLQSLLQRILSETEVERVRLSSIQPQDVTPELLELWSDRRLCPHFHMALQSGSDSVLRRMGRRYSVADYAQAITVIRETVPQVATTTDVIVGFPGESTREFEEGLHFCEKMCFARMHVFSYSVRPGTSASQMPDQVDERTKKQRSRRMLELAERSAERFQGGFLGTRMTVLWEEKKAEDGIWTGLTDNYLRTYTRCSSQLSNSLLPAKLIGRYEHGLWAELL